MFIQILRSFLGPFVVILDFLLAKPEILGLLFSLYLVTLGIGKLQVKRIKTRTDQLILEKSSTWLVENPKLTKKQLFDRFYPIWEKELAGFRFPLIMNKHDLWPVSVTADHVLVKFPLTPDYLYEKLVESGITKGKQISTLNKKKPKKQ